MAYKHFLIHALRVSNEKSGGARGTGASRLQQGKRFINWYIESGQKKLNKLADIDPAVLLDYVKYLEGRGVKTSSIHTYLGYVRVLLRGARVNLEGYETNHAVGAKSRNRHGTKEPFPDSLWNELLKRALKLDEGMFHLLRIERLTGARGLEALMSASSLKRWIRDIQYLQSVHISKGTKGGRPRYTDVIRVRLDETRTALIEAYEYIRKNKFFIKTKNGGLKSARQRYHRLARKLGLVGKHAPHSLRYAWACEKALELVEAGLTRKEILSFLSNCLGHGDSRYRWVKLVYAASIAGQLPPPTRLGEELYAIVSELAYDDVVKEEHDDAALHIPIETY